MRKTVSDTKHITYVILATRWNNWLNQFGDVEPPPPPRSPNFSNMVSRDNSKRKTRVNDGLRPQSGTSWCCYDIIGVSCSCK